ncbi:unnamed protein product, partial [marine sediment metagenome]
YEEINLEIEIYGYKVNPIDTFPNFKIISKSTMFSL